MFGRLLFTIKLWVCGLCGCPLASKARSEDEICDAGKWHVKGL